MPTETSNVLPAPPGPARFSLAANYDPELVPALAPYPIDEVYGKFATDGVSGGRPRYLATPLSEADLWTIIYLDSRARYMEALEADSVEGNIRPFTEYLRSEQDQALTNG